MVKSKENQFLISTLIIVIMLLPTILLWGFKYDWEMNPPNLGKL